MRVLNEVSHQAPVAIRRCPAGLQRGVIPLPGPQGRRTWIECGQVFLSSPRSRDFAAFCARLRGGGPTPTDRNLERAFFDTPVLSQARLEAGIVLLRGIIAQFKLQTDSDDQPHLGLTADPVKQACQYIEQQPDEPIRLSDLAAHVRLNPAHLCRLFKRRTGQTLGEFISNLRVERAKELLTHGRSRVADVAFASGFESVRQFNDVFKAHTQLTPREFRRAAELPQPAGLNGVVPVLGAAASISLPACNAPVTLAAR